MSRWSSSSVILVHLSDSRRADSFRRTHRHSHNCHHIEVSRLCSRHSRTESRTVGSILMYKMPHSRLIGLHTRHDRRTLCPMECIGPCDIGTSLPSNCRATFPQYSANIFRSIHLNYRRSPARKTELVWCEKNVFAPRLSKMKPTWTLLHSAPRSTQAPYEHRNLSSRHWKEMHSSTVSSLPSLQSTFPLHRSLMPMHSPLPQTHDKIASQLLFCAVKKRENLRKNEQDN